MSVDRHVRPCARWGIKRPAKKKTVVCRDCRDCLTREEKAMWS